MTSKPYTMTSKPYTMLSSLLSGSSSSSPAIKDTSIKETYVIEETPLRPGFKFDPSDVDNVKLCCWAAAGNNNIDFLRKEGVRSNHPSLLYGSSEPINPVRKVHMAWDESLFRSPNRYLDNGDYFWHDIEKRVTIYEGTKEEDLAVGVSGTKKQDLPIGFYRRYTLVEDETRLPTEWVLREFRSYEDQYQDFPKSIYEISFETEVYLKARLLMQEASLAIADAYKHFLNTSKPVDRSDSGMKVKGKGKSPLALLKTMSMTRRK